MIHIFRQLIKIIFDCLQGGAGRRRLRETSSSSTSGTSQTGSFDSDQSGDESAAPPLPQRPRLEAARLPVTCHCAKCKGLTTKTAIEAERHIQQWGRHDEGESSQAASSRRREVQSRSRPAVRDILRHSFIQFSLSAIHDFATQLRTNRALVEPDVEHIMEPTANVESHHPFTDQEVHGVEGKSIMVVERYVAPYRDDAPKETKPSLFPYVGSVYSHDEWLVLVGAHPTGFRTYLLDVDSWRGSSMPREEYRFVDGDPARCPNLVGYINSVIGTRPLREPNVMWVLIEDPPASYGRRDLEFHVATVPTRPMQAGDELLCDYPWGSGSLGTPCVFPPRRR
ncbi:hypothetical protein R1sor_026312 [Riccia sorocarpa]|uniref:SET domain-containing protein n=1 Tax=Riccia sorocarpa TaxID=122646 RepID=A0ABD3GD37_9MARC